MLFRCWQTLSSFVRAQVVVSLVDAVFIGIGLVVLEVPLAPALIVLTFVAGFVPIIGAVTVGALSVLVALVSNGRTTALIVLGVVPLVQQQSNVLQPLLQGRSLELHPVVVLLGVTAGGTLYGIIGAFLAVPTVAVATTVLRYASKQVSIRSSEVDARDLHSTTPEGFVALRQAERASRLWTHRLRRQQHGESTAQTTG